MTSKYWLFLFLILSSSCVKASIYSDIIIFSGTVLEKQSGKPLAGATVTISDLKMATFTDESGRFTFNNISAGNHLLEISHVGYSTMAEYIDMTINNNKVYHLSLSVVENNTVVVTGVSRATQLKKVPFQVDLINKKDLFQNTASNIIESITTKAGVSSLSSGPAISKPFIRGLGYNRVLVINDGVRQEGQQWGDEHGIEIDDASVNKIEVLKGPASLVYGSDALAGVINIISNAPVAPQSIQFEAGTEYQSNNGLRSCNAHLSGNNNGISWNAYGTMKAAKDYRNRYDGHVFNSRFNNQDYGAFMGINKRWGYSHLIFSNYDLNAGLVEGERDSLGRFVKNLAGGSVIPAGSDDFNSVHPDFPYQHIIHRKIASDNRLKIGNHMLNFNLGWQQNLRAEYGNPDMPDEKELFFKLNTLTYSAQFHLNENNNWKHSVGINGMDQQNINKGISQLIPDYHLFDFGIFYFVQKEWKKLSMSGGVRYDNRSLHAERLTENNVVKNEAFSKSFSNLSASLGLTYVYDSNLNFKANIARAFRTPGIPELASNGAHEGTVRYEYGNRSLSSEISTQGDFSAELSYDHFRLNIAGYLNYFNNFIFYRKLRNRSGSDSLVEDRGQLLSAFTFEQHKAILAGTEISLDFHPHPLDWLHIENTFSWVTGKFINSIDGSKNLPFIPAPRLLTELKADLNTPKKFFKNSFVKIEIDNTMNQSNPFLGYNTETITKGYTLLNLAMGSDIVFSKNRQTASVYLSLNNLFDVAYQNHLSRLKYTSVNPVTGRQGVFNTGRNLIVKLNVPLRWKLK